MKVSEHVLIEADSSDEANVIAETKGIYFDGVNSGEDCPCCGDRWLPVDDWDEMSVSDFLARYGGKDGYVKIHRKRM